MADANEDKNLAEFFESLLEDPTERQIIKLLLEGKEGDEVIDELSKMIEKRDKKNQTRKGQ